MQNGSAKRFGLPVTRPADIAPTPPREEKTVTIELPLVDALAVGHSLRAIAKSRAFPGSETARMYRDVGDKLVTAANEELRK